jgi:mono/diheme cytochrome c family protein
MMKTLMAIALLALCSQAGAQQLDGKAVFAKNCAACHMAAGTGIPGAFPALKGNKFVQGDPKAVISTVLKGRGGMPTFAASLDDASLAQVISYVRSSWDNTATPVTAPDVLAVRSESNAGDVVKKEQPTNVH